MKRYNRSAAIAIAVILIAIAFAALPAMTQQITGEPGLAHIQQQRSLFPAAFGRGLPLGCRCAV